MEMRLLTFCSLTILFHSAISYKEVDYYWKDYNGDIPSDAYPAGQDVNGKTTYIGQAYIHSFALGVAQIQPGKEEVDVACYGVKKATRNIKILCTNNPKKLSWVPTTAQTFQMDTIGLHPVPGGSDEVNGKGLLNIGRLMYQGILKIGAVAAYAVENARLYFPHDNTEHSASMYHILVYNHSASESFDKTIPCVDLRSALGSA